MVKNINRLKGKIAENDYTMLRLSQDMGMTETTLRNKINKPEADFSIGESEKLSHLLGLTMEEYIHIFLDDKLEYSA